MALAWQRVSLTRVAVLNKTLRLVRLCEVGLFCASLLLVVSISSWMLHGAMFFFGDEFGNLGRVYGESYGQIFNVLPEIVYNDRPVGLIFIRVLYDVFGFDYLKQMAVYLLVHVLNFALAFLVSRHILKSTIFALIAAAMFGANVSTVASAWYLGAVFDVLCTTFLLSSLYAYMQGGNWRRIVSPILFFFALRSKEIAVVFPLLLVLIEWHSERFSTRPRTLGLVLSRVGVHLIILGVVLAAYAQHLGEYASAMASQPDNPYIISLAPASLLSALNHYVALVVYATRADPTTTGPGYWMLLVALVAFSIAFRRFWVFFGVVSFVALLTPVMIVPRQTTDFYLYAPSVFLFLAIADVLRWAARVIESRFALAQGRAALPAYAGVMVCLLVLNQTAYDHTEIEFLRTSRQIMFRDAQPILNQQLHFGHGAHYYVDGLKPYLNPFSSGPCYFLQIYYRDPDVRCFVEMPTAQLESLYAADTAERYFFVYKDATLTLRASDPASSSKSNQRT